MKTSRFLVWLALAAAALAITLLVRLPLADAWPALLGAIVLADVAWVDGTLRRAMAHGRRPTERATRYPSVTIIRPVRGRDVGAFENFVAALDTGYPGDVETLFVFDDEDDPGLPVAAAAIAEHQLRRRAGHAELVIAGAPPDGVTGKLNAMIVGVEHARGELIAFGDSDTRPDRDVLRGLVDALSSTPRAGAAFAPVVVPDPPEAAGDVLYALMQNALYGPWAVRAAGDERTLPFIMGQFMIFRRPALAAIGGVGSAAGQLVDDMYLGRRVHEAGWRNVMSRVPLRIATGGMSAREFWPVYRRWLQFSRNGLPLSFTWPQWLIGVEFFALVVAALTALAAGATTAAGVALLALFGLGWHLYTIGTVYGGAPLPLRWLWTPFALIGAAPAVVLANLLRPEVHWRGRDYRVDRAAALLPSTPDLDSPDGAPVNGKDGHTQAFPGAAAP